jgi:hypothetical protein
METRVSRLEDDVHDMKVTLNRLEISVAEIRAVRNATLPHLATKADLPEKPGKTCMCGILAALLTVYPCGLAALAILK